MRADVSYIGKQDEHVVQPKPMGDPSAGVDADSQEDGDEEEQEADDDDSHGPLGLWVGVVGDWPSADERDAGNLHFDYGFLGCARVVEDC